MHTNSTTPKIFTKNLDVAQKINSSQIPKISQDLVALHARMHTSFTLSTPNNFKNYI